MTSQYRLLAEQASNTEKKKQWHEAEALWQQAFEQTLPGNKNHRWAYSRAKFCQVQAYGPRSRLAHTP